MCVFHLYVYLYSMRVECVLCVCILFAYISIYHVCRGPKRKKLELQTVVSSHVGVWDQTLVLCKISKCFSLLSRLCSPVLWVLDVSWYNKGRSYWPFPMFPCFLEICCPLLPRISEMLVTVTQLPWWAELLPVTKISCCVLGLLNFRALDAWLPGDSLPGGLFRAS